MTTTTEFQHFSDDTDCFVKQRRTAAVQTGSFSGDAHILAWTPKGDDVHKRQLCTMQICIIGKYGFLGSGSTYRSLEETASQKPVKYHFNVVSFFLFRSKQA